jgi:hypothetical protein
MHDFIQNLSFNSSAPFAPARAASAPLRAVLRSYNEVPESSFRPSPRRRIQKTRIVNRKSKILL